MNIKSGHEHFPSYSPHLIFRCNHPVILASRTTDTQIYETMYCFSSRSPSHNNSDLQTSLIDPMHLLLIHGLLLAVFANEHHLMIILMI